MTCRTKTEKNCKLPFIYKGITYEKCPVDPIDPNETWCSTKTDSNGVHISGNGHFGFCSSECDLCNDRHLNGKSINFGNHLEMLQ